MKNKRNERFKAARSFKNKASNNSKKRERDKIKFKQKQKQSPGDVVGREASVLKLGTFNINGLDSESGFAVQDLVKERSFDVSIVCFIL